MLSRDLSGHAVLGTKAEFSNDAFCEIQLRKSGLVSFAMNVDTKKTFCRALAIECNPKFIYTGDDSVNVIVSPTIYEEVINIEDDDRTICKRQGSNCDCL